MTRGPLELVDLVAGVLDELAIPYALGGSLASSLFGEPRSTVDVDIAIRVPPEAAGQLLAGFGPEFYIPTEAAERALDEHGSFNILDTASGLKIDLFVLSDDALDTFQIERRVPVTIPGLTRTIWVTAPEVQVLRKLSWHQQGGAVSDRQWRDVVSILRVTTSLDHEFLAATARQLNLDRQLEAALSDAAEA